MCSVTTMATPAPSSATQIVDGWFAEKETMWPGQRFSLQVKGAVLHQEHSGMQDILVFDSTDYGRVLVLDGVIQLTEKDEFAYQEAITHLPMFAHPNPKSVLIVGGGDGGVAREVSRHAGVEKVRRSFQFFFCCCCCSLLLCPLLARAKP